MTLRKYYQVVLKNNQTIEKRLKDEFEESKKFGEGQPTDRGGRPKKQPFVEIIEEWLKNDGFIEFEAKDVELLSNGDYRIVISNQQMVANKFLEMVMKGDARFMEMYMKLFGEYNAEKHDITVTQFPLRGINFDNLTDAQ